MEFADDTHLLSLGSSRGLWHQPNLGSFVLTRLNNFSVVQLVSLFKITDTIVFSFFFLIFPCELMSFAVVQCLSWTLVFLTEMIELIINGLLYFFIFPCALMSGAVVCIDAVELIIKLCCLFTR